MNATRGSISLKLVNFCFLNKKKDRNAKIIHPVHLLSLSFIQKISMNVTIATHNFQSGSSTQQNNKKKINIKELKKKRTKNDVNDT